ncbi:TadE/TadG family type IV pilus assembly protein [Salipiger sp.]|uniref:TadE/TadG family type IV pilus assembly protein n=1 Tax=Salipiger sp. TaxID=2078585 RepID=UPI003A96D969
MNKFLRNLTGFFKREDGSVTVESVIWLPMFLMLLTMMIDVSMVFNRQSEMMRIVQDANRAYSVGRISTSEAAEEFILTAIAAFAPTATVSTSFMNGVVRTRLIVPTSDLMPINTIPVFRNRSVVVETEQLAEF